MSDEANAVLKKMEVGFALFGFPNDYGRPFRLSKDRSWENVSPSVVQELIESGSIEAVADRGDGEKEYRSVTE
jgi:hypothetical protein